MINKPCMEDIINQKFQLLFLAKSVIPINWLCPKLTVQFRRNISLLSIENLNTLFRQVQLRNYALDQQGIANMNEKKASTNRLVA